MNIDLLLGKTTEHLVTLEGTKHSIHKQMLADYLKLQSAAKKEDINLQIVSAFRDYERQLKIWNAKARGERPLLDAQEKPLEFSTLTPQQIVEAILRYSALPGCSRHHWGTDIDVFDANTQQAEDVKLLASECENGGPATRLHEWLDERMKTNQAFGFFRPYKTERDGIAPERWHISYYPLSRRMVDEYTFRVFKRSIEDSSIVLKDVILGQADDIYHRFILNFDLP